MYPSLLSNQIQQHMRLFLQQMFPVSTPWFRDIIQRLTEREGGVFQGPWYELRLPFRKADAQVSNFFSLLSFPYTPHQHQAEAFARLCGETPSSTLVATGTGSGKTECFLYPILEHCAQAFRRQERGIKAVILYPMNALATDQARRFARTVHQNEALRGVRVGLYVGGSIKGATEMSDGGVITDRHAMQENPPDILLTNYKMLDYLLVRREDSTLWKHNTADTLRYLVVDELHTFDGAQATDLACLIRRLKERLGTPHGYLCCVGTSATLGGEGDAEPLFHYASTVFGEPFEETGLVRESIMTAQEFRGGAEMEYFKVPGKEAASAMSWDGSTPPDEWLKSQFRLWFEEEPPDFSTPEGCFALGEKLLSHRFLAELLSVCQKRRQWVMAEKELMEAIVCMERGLEEREVFRAALGSFLSLCAKARRYNPENSAHGGSEPFLKLHAHLWMRELSAMMCPVKLGEDGKPELGFYADMPMEQKQHSLPLVYCLDCGRMSWGCVTAPMKTDTLAVDRDRFIKAFFGNDQDAWLLTPVMDNEQVNVVDLFEDSMLCPHCMKLYHRKADTAVNATCPVCGERMVRVLRERFAVETPGGYRRKECPCCRSREGLMIVGSRSASMNSTAIGTMFASSCNDDRKLLTFSDNVQDASHRAGFFTGRTYQSTLRIALNQAIRGMAAQQGELSLVEACKGIGPWWRQQMSAERFVCTFMPPDKEWLDDYETLLEKNELPEGSDLTDIVSERLSWELFGDLSWRCRRGRTLERSACCILTPGRSLLEDVARKLATLSVEQLGSAYKLPEQALQQWLTGLLHWLRIHGAIMLPMLEAYASHANAHIFTQRFQKSLRGITKESGPRFLTDAPKSPFMPAFAQSGNIAWPEDWTLKMPWSSQLQRLHTHDFIRLALKLMLQEGILLGRGYESGFNMGLNPDLLKLTNKVSAVRCSECGQHTPVPADMANLFSGMPCLRKGCQGRLVEDSIPDNASRHLYESGMPVRLRAAEHTGLLERGTRERIEEEFISQSPLTAPNVLSCTPTLEMGIDIGNLSSVLLCSVPPSVASFRQRVGRAGRRDGNALTLTTASNQVNDLYFYHTPESMVRGQVDMPGVFLKAPAILERQLFAFCLDEWIKREPLAAVPQKLRQVLASLEQEGQFPRNLFRFIETREEEILSRFIQMLDLQADASIRDELELCLKGDENKEGSLAYRVASCLHRTRMEREDYSRKRKSYANRIDKFRTKAERGLSPAEEEELAQLREARSGMNKLIAELDKKDTLGFLTDEGLLPNYAFPEEGVTLHSVILKRAQKDGKNSYDALSMDYVRAGASAITEFAPGNAFYVEGRKVTIDQINLKTSEEEEWVFCPECTHMERVGENGTSCPRCHADWRDGSHRRSMIRLNQVMSTVSDRRSRSLDDKDEREPSFYSRHMAVSIPENKEGQAWALDSEHQTFAYQYIQQATFREINMGNMFNEGSSLLINGKEVQSSGFEICAKCGKLLKGRKDTNHLHDLDCPYRDKPAHEQKKKTLLLYRELKSEAVRVLLPNSDEDPSAVKEAFMATLMLGLKEYFKGNIGHLRLCEDSIKLGEPPNERAYPCFVIYDSVPGGTGYLKELCQKPETLLQVLELALHKMEACSCAQDPDKDGCHLCLLSARRSRNSAPSRRVAMKLLHEVLAEKEKLKKLNRIGGVNVNPLIGSELEARFLAWLRENYLLREQLIQGTPGYLLRVGDLTWEVQLQKEIASTNPAEITKPDFLITPLRQRDSRPIAVYLDGRTWHASENVNRMSGDIRKREALRRNHKYLVWTLTWDDMSDCGKPLPPLPLNEKTRDALPRMPHMVPFDRRHAVMRWLQPSNPLYLLDYLLQHGSNKDKLMQDWQVAAGLLALSFNQPGSRRSASLVQMRNLMEQGCDDAVDWKLKDGEEMVASVREESPWRMLAMISQERMNALAFEQIVARLSFNSDVADDSDHYAQQWRAFWHLYNILQVLPEFRATTPELGRSGYRYETMGDMDVAHDAACLTAEDLEELDADWIAFLCGLKLELKPEIFYEAEDAEGELTAPAEVVWPEHRVVLLRQDDAETAESFRKLGWSVLMWGAPETELSSQLKDLLTQNC